MLFNSLDFIYFFIIVTVIYFIIPHKFRTIFLLIASCFFYSYFIPIYILILFFTILIDYSAGILIEKSTRNKKSFLLLSLSANVLILSVFKYYNFVNDIISSFLGVFHYTNTIPYLKILLPIGLSFHTFQAMSYTIEVYRGNQKAERNFDKYALYVMFFPQLVAGPIERPQNLLHQFYEKHIFDIHRIGEGVKLMLWGYFKKCVVADRIAIYVNSIYDAPYGHKGFELILATFFFAIQIYCDFSGYSDIAIGSANILGFKLMTNFNKPYFSRSVSEFWKRWHISLSTWFKDYLYIPLGGNKVGKWRWYFNLLITFTISGLWHGANFTYIVWGALNGFFLIFEILIKKCSNSYKNINAIYTYYHKANFLRIIVTFCCINFTWIFFRAANMKEAMYVVANVFRQLPQTFHILKDNLNYISVVLIFILIEIIQRNKKYSPFLPRTNAPLLKIINVCIYSIFIWSIIVFGEFGIKEFIYFQF